jgi:hypothetical protein
MKRQNLIHILMAIVCFALSPLTRAVDPPHTPDPPPLPISNTADGDLALVGVTGLYNSAFGTYALLGNGAASFNTGIGADVLLSNTANEQTAVGCAALFSNTTGGFNTASGTFALFLNTEGENNTAIGDRALQNNTTGSLLTPSVRALSLLVPLLSRTLPLALRRSSLMTRADSALASTTRQLAILRSTITLIPLITPPWGPSRS